LDRLTSSQISEWEVYDRIDPIGGVKDDFRMAFLAHLMVNISRSVHGKRGTKMSGIKEFMPNWEKGTIGEAKAQTIEEMKQVLLAMASKSYKNMLTNGGFSSAGSWTPSGGASFSIVDSKGVITGNGVSANPYIYQGISLTANNVYYISLKAKVTNSLCTRIAIVTNDGSLIFEKAGYTPNAWDELSFLATPLSNRTSMQFWHQYSTALIANEKVMEIDNVFCINLTTTFGAGNEPTKAWCDAFLPFIP